MIARERLEQIIRQLLVEKEGLEFLMSQQK